MAALFGAVLLVTVAATTAEDYSRTLVLAEARTREAARVLGDHARRAVDASDRALLEMAQVLRAQGPESLTGSVGFPVLSRLASTLPEATTLLVVGPDARIRASSRFVLPPADWVGDREYWMASQADDNLHIGPMIQGRHSGRRIFTVSRAVRSPSGKLLGVVLAGISPTYIADYLSWAGDGVKLSFGLFREDGSVVLHVPELPDAGGNVRAAWMFGIYPRRLEATVRAADMPGGRELIATFHKVEGLPLLASASVSPDEVFHDWRLRLWRNVTLTALALIGLAGLTWHALRAYQREHRSQAEVIRSSARLSLALDAAQAAVWEWCPTTGTAEWTAGNWQILGLPPDTPPSPEAWRASILPEDLLRAEATIREAIRTLRPAVAIEFRVPEGIGCRWILSSLHLYYDEGGVLLRLAGVNIDITRLKEAERRLDTARREAERADEAKSRFLAAASHDLRQPAQSLALLLPTLAPLVAGTPAQPVVAVMEEAIGALSALLTSLLDISRLDAGMVEARYREVSLGALFARLAEDYSPQANERGLRLRWVHSTARVATDPALLERVLRNLVDNALRFTPQGGVVLGCRRKAGRVTIMVADTGPGIPADKVEAVFEEFVQLHNEARDRTYGLGLGLAIVRRLATLLGAQVELRSIPGRGSSFLVTFAAA